MPSKIISTSGNVAILDSTIIASLCDGYFHVDLSGTVWIGAGASNVEGASVKIINPYGVIIKDYLTSGYDIYPPMTSDVDVQIPTQASNFQYGAYTVDVRLTDSDGIEYFVSKQVNICQPDAKNKTKNYGSLSAQLNGICKDGKMYVIVDTPPNYKGKVVQNQVNDFTLEYPTSSGEDPLETNIGSFSVTLYEGVWKIDGTICATYNYGDNIFFEVNYKVKKKKEVFCSIDECCVFEKLAEINGLVNSECTQAEKDRTASITIDALRLLKTAQLAADCGQDPSDYIRDLEKLLGCSCTCNCNYGTPIINNNPAKDFNITGCNVTKQTVGLTDNYIIENYVYAVSVSPNGGALVVSSSTLNACTRTTTLLFNISTVYSQIKTLSNANTTESNFWASVVNKTLSSIDAICIGYSAPQWSIMTLPQRFAAVINFMCECCGCTATVSDDSIENIGENAILRWTSSGAYSIDIYLDSVFVGNVLSSETSFTLLGVADGLEHTYLITAKCADGKLGTSVTDTFVLLACPDINPPSVSSNNENGVDCPYDLTALVAELPAGIAAEWHTENNTSDNTLLGDPENVNSGVYYVFAKNTDGCYSIGVQVTVICSSESDCTAPQTLFVSTIVGGNLVQFDSATFPPPLNSYTVFRKLAAAADIPANYITIGTPAFNSGSGKWEILDGAAINNTLYTYKAQSNCGGGSKPYVLYTYGNITCGVLTLTPNVDMVDYSFVPVGGGITKYEVRIYDSSGVTLIHTDTILPAFTNPETGTFLYLSASTIYKVRLRTFLGTYYKDCPFVITTTGSDQEDIEGDLEIIGVKELQVTLSVPAPCSDVIELSGSYIAVSDGETYGWSCNYVLNSGDTVQEVQDAISGLTGLALVTGDVITDINFAPTIDFNICSGTVLLTLTVPAS